jgi:hypothetical protein
LGFSNEPSENIPVAVCPTLLNLFTNIPVTNVKKTGYYVAEVILLKICMNKVPY